MMHTMIHIMNAYECYIYILATICGPGTSPRTTTWEVAEIAEKLSLRSWQMCITSYQHHIKLGRLSKQSKTNFPKKTKGQFIRNQIKQHQTTSNINAKSAMESDTSLLWGVEPSVGQINLESSFTHRRYGQNSRTSRTGFKLARRPQGILSWSGT